MNDFSINRVPSNKQGCGENRKITAFPSSFGKRNEENDDDDDDDE